MTEDVRQVSLFDSHRLNSDGALKVAHVRDAFAELVLQINKVCPEGREFSLAQTRLEEAAMFAVRAVSKAPDNQE